MSENLEQLESDATAAVHKWLIAAGAADESDVVACMSISLRLASPFNKAEAYRAALVGGTYAEGIGLATYASGFYSARMMEG
ncbi:hypothetical protein PBI_WOES_69 [Gordonia phage Woes]|uniref:Uncharacterized protein n=13 Tax=Woesvirus woes TaxID=1982751 RepID=A0A482JGJ8_9CAUD|nr:hypothetical protein BH793_gp44 [Gordonia phage Woes]ATW61164.1 hypothetical protein SEA_ANAMIKA_69 [Gordonia phage Anamika]AVP43253.1 hypothetical protein PBI_HAIL2PITT_68 [Gordonia phage Hail2Pitt]QAX94352.1 hypothetical protein SEA_GUILLAUME_69 [Gordonia phage Guillaume]QAX94675.1 hypothetical protein SEA_HARAMBE_69 [Gordonia phage Harambe]QAX95338.1 hypothetical protein SEA_HELLO_69 [Gordonia phage Hello]QAX95430.1 hypothetical protein SEA_NEOEVIE_69 [Gordonia phage Neoevie]QBP30346.1